MKESIHAVRELPSLLGCVDYVPAKASISILKSFTFSCVGKNVLHFCQSPISSTEELVTWKLVCVFLMPYVWLTYLATLKILLFQAVVEYREQFFEAAYSLALHSSDEFTHLSACKCVAAIMNKAPIGI